jgi:protein tyrosine phosphatase type 4A
VLQYVVRVTEASRVTAFCGLALLVARRQPKTNKTDTIKRNEMENRSISPSRFQNNRTPTPSGGNPRELFNAAQTKVLPTTHSPYSHRSSVIKWQKCPVNFVITDCPSNDTLPIYIQVFSTENVKDLIRISQNDVYDKATLEMEGIKVWDDLKFEDGTVPSPQIVAKLRNIIRYIVLRGEKPGLAIHCVSGIGRAPLFATISLCDYGMDPLDAIELVRSKRRGSLNRKQVDWIVDGFKPIKGMPMGPGTSEQVAQAKKAAEAPLGVVDAPTKSAGGFFGFFGKK